MTSSSDISTESAAQRVLALPELLEAILLQVAALPRTANQNAYPASDLFVLQRVDKTFRDTISGSRSIRQHMFFSPFPQTSGTPRPHGKQALDWLVRSIGVDGDGMAIFCFGGLVWVDPVEANRIPHFKGPEASWRKIKTHRDENDPKVRIQYCGRGDATLRSFSFGDDLTLGELHNGLQRLIAIVATLRDVYRKHHPAKNDDKDGIGRQQYEEAVKCFRDECAREDFWER